MSLYVECATQAELDAVPAGKIAVVRNGRFVAWESSRVVARESSRVEARESSSVVARESSRVVAWESSSVVAWESSRVEARGSSSVEAAPLVAVHRFSREAVTKGGVIIDCTRIHEDIGEWCAYYGTVVKRGRVTVFKALDDELRSGHGHKYPVGKTVKCDDWNPKPVCGGGLHFCADPRAAQARYFPRATRFLECTIAARDAVIVGDKLKAPACRVVREVDVCGDPVEGEGDE